MQTVWWIILVSSILTYILFTGIVFPRVFIKSGYKVTPYDRGMKSFKEEDGKSVVYLPKPEYRKYISQYILSKREGKNVIICKLNESICYIDYDIVLFDCNDKVFKAINVNESIKNPGYTCAVVLPPQTAYATLVINFIDDINIDSDMVKKISGRGLARFAAVSGLLTVLEVFCVKLCISNIFGDVFTWDFTASA